MRLLLVCRPFTLCTLYVQYEQVVYFHRLVCERAAVGRAFVVGSVRGGKVGLATRSLGGQVTSEGRQCAGRRTQHRGLRRAVRGAHGSVRRLRCALTRVRHTTGHSHGTTMRPSHFIPHRHVTDFFTHISHFFSRLRRHLRHDLGCA